MSSSHSPMKCSKKLDYGRVYADSELAAAIADLEGTFGVINEENLYRNLVNTSKSSNEPYHRWARYREAYSGELVKELIKRDTLNSRRQYVYDPMCGSGSTLVAAVQQGFDALGTDTNLYSVDLTNAKLSRLNTRQLHMLETFIQSPPVASAKTCRDSFTMEDSRKYFNSTNYGALNSILSEIKSVRDKKVQHLLHIAWLTILEDCSERRKNGNGLVTRPSPVRDVWPRFSEQVYLFLNDLTAHPLPVGVAALAYKKNAILSGSIVDRFSTLSGKELGAIIFSPPYANSFDYIESYKLELLGGDYYGQKGLSEARKGAIRGYRKGYGIPLTTDDPLLSALCHEVRARIPKKERRMGTRDNRSRLVPNLIIGYFEDMSKVLAEFWKCMPSDSVCHIVVDQSSYLGVIIPTDLLLARSAEQLEFIIEPLVRCRKANTSSQQLRQYPYLRIMLRESIVTFRKP